MQHLSVVLACLAAFQYNDCITFLNLPAGAMSRVTLAALSISSLLFCGFVCDKAHAGGKDALSNAQNESMAAAIVAQTNKEQADAKALQDTPLPKYDTPPPSPPGPPP